MGTAGIERDLPTDGEQTIVPFVEAPEATVCRYVPGAGQLTERRRLQRGRQRLPRSERQAQRGDRDREDPALPLLSRVKGYAHPVRPFRLPTG